MRSLAVMFAVALVGVCAAAAAEPAAPGPLLFRDVSFSVVDGKLRLRVEAVAPWADADVGSAAGRTLCVLFWSGDRASPRSRLCFAGGGQLEPSIEQLAPSGAVLAAGTVRAAVARPDSRTATAELSPTQIGLRSAVFFWRAESSWSGTAPCGGACDAAFPAIGKETVDLRPRNTLEAQFEPQAHEDSRDVTDGPLDVSRVAFGQVDAHLTLDVRTRGQWQPADLARDQRELCIVIERGTPRQTAGRLCTGSDRDAVVLHYQPIDRAGRPGAWRQLDAVVSRPDRRSLRAIFAPSAIGLRPGPFTWSMTTSWRDDAACTATCRDDVPDNGVVRDAVRILAQPRCFAAAARDPERRCHNPALRSVVLPSPADAQLLPNSPCHLVAASRTTVLHPCEFGVTSDQRRRTFALIGDSHAAMWRPALEVVAQARRWRGVSITRPGCPFSVRIPSSPDLDPTACGRLHRETIGWLKSHRDVDTIFVASWAQPASGPMGGTGGYGGDASAFGAMLDLLPPSVRRVYVLRDPPGTSIGTPSCIQAALHRRMPMNGVCATPRSAALTPDPAARAAVGRSQVRVIDLTRVFCGPAQCYPLIGGGYVYKDDNHINARFATSLGPLVLRRLTG